MKLLDINGTVHLPTFTNDTERAWIEHEGRHISPGFTHTGCARVFGGGPDAEGGLDLVDCPACLESPAFNQAGILAEMMGE